MEIFHRTDRGVTSALSGAAASASRSSRRELGEYLAQVPLHRAAGQERLGGDLRVGAAVGGEAGDVRLLRGEHAGRLGDPLAQGLAGSQQLVPGR